MIDERERFEEAFELFDRPEPAWDRLVGRRDRRRRNQRIAAGVVGFAVFVAAVLIVTTGGSLDRTQTPVVPGEGVRVEPTVTGPTETGPSYNGPTYSLGPVSDDDIAVGEAFIRAWVKGDGVTAAALFTPDGSFEGHASEVLPTLHDWFRAGGWTFSGDGCGVHGWDDTRGVVGCGVEFENDLTRALEMRPVGIEISFVIESGSIVTAWFGGGGDTLYNLFGTPDPEPRNLYADVWDMFIETLSSQNPEDFARMYDPDRGFPVPGFPILDADSIDLWERYTDEFVASPQALRRSFDGWLAGQTFEDQASRICRSATEGFWETEGSGGDLRGREFGAAVADVSEEILAELRALPLGTDADRATMDAFVPLAEQWIELFRRAAEEDRDVPFFQRRDLQVSMGGLIHGCLLSYGFPG